MTQFRVTKYDPRRRGEDGAFLDHDWTSVTDIGKNFRSGVLTYPQYRIVEDAYVDSVKRLMAVAGVNSLQIAGLEDHGEHPLRTSLVLDDIERRMPTLQEGKRISGEDVDIVIRLNLRERIWCRLLGDRYFFVHFGFDYHMYVGLPPATNALPLLPVGMYRELFNSPHMPEETQ